MIPPRLELVCSAVTLTFDSDAKTCTPHLHPLSCSLRTALPFLPMPEPDRHICFDRDATVTTRQPATACTFRIVFRLSCRPEPQSAEMICRSFCTSRHEQRSAEPISLTIVPTFYKLYHISDVVRIDRAEDHWAGCAGNHCSGRFAIDIESLVKLAITIAKRTSRDIRYFAVCHFVLSQDSGLPNRSHFDRQKTLNSLVDFRIDRHGIACPC